MGHFAVLKRDVHFYEPGGGTMGGVDDPLLKAGEIVFIEYEDVDGDLRLRSARLPNLLSAGWVHPAIVRRLSPLELLALELVE